jgi:hypothetical protein
MRCREYAEDAGGQVGNYVKGSAERGYILFGCHIGVSNFILGGRRGYCGGNERRALKNPPRYGG